MSKDSEKQSAQGFASRNEDCRAIKFETEGFAPNLPASRMPLGKARQMDSRNKKLYDGQRPSPVRSGK